jgi:hypothetical protein
MPGRRFALYFAWSRPLEIGANLGTLENRFPSLFEFRRALWPAFEKLKESTRFDQGIAGFMDHVILADFDLFQEVIRESTGHTVRVIQRQGDKPPAQELDETLLREVDTLIVVSLDHRSTSQNASPGEVDMVRAFLGRDDKCVVVCPHHFIGEDESPAALEREFRHHGDRTIPAKQVFGGFARTLLAGLGFEVDNRFGLRPAATADGSPAPLAVFRDLDEGHGGLNILRGVSTFNLHPHLPHLHVGAASVEDIEVLARQAIEPRADTHPFVQAGNRWFNALLRLRASSLAGTVLVGDATLWSSAFGGRESLLALWKNLALMNSVRR